MTGMSADDNVKLEYKESIVSSDPDNEALRCYRHALRTRILCERMMQLSDVPAIRAAIDNTGYETVQVLCVTAIDTKVDYILPSPRDLGIVMALNMPIREVIQGYLDRTDDLPTTISLPHWNSRDLRIINATDHVGTLALHAAGIAFAAHFRHESALTLTFVDDVAIHKADCIEAMRFAGMHQLPVIFVFAHRQITSPEEYIDVSQYGVTAMSVDGQNHAAVLRQSQYAIHLVRSGNGPILLNIAIDPRQDALTQWRHDLMTTGILTSHYETGIIQQCQSEIAAAEKTIGLTDHIQTRTFDKTTQEKV